jgi:hypothetical protein
MTSILTLYEVKKLLYKNKLPCDFVLGKEIGVGVDGAVYQACCGDDCSKYVLKHVKLMFDPIEKFRTEVEAQIIASRTGYAPEILMAYEINDEEGAIIMHQLKSSLSKIIISNDYTLEYKKSLINQMFDILIAIEKQGVYQQDCHVDNFMFDYDGNLKIIDFGFSVIGEKLDMSNLNNNKNFKADMKILLFKLNDLHILPLHEIDALKQVVVDRLNQLKVNIYS